MANGLFDTLEKLFFSKEKVHKHWYVPVDNFQFSSSDFYQRIEKELEARKVPDLEMSRIELKEGGMLSDKREYLRLRRERLVFDICAAPFGTSYFFSFRSVEIPLVIKLWQVFIFLMGFFLVFGLLQYRLGVLYGLASFFALILGAIWTMRISRKLGSKSLDAILLKTAVIGPIYEVFFRKETYHREDTRLMYISTVNSITEKLVEEVTLAKGVKLLKRYDRKPILSDLYEERPKPLQTNTQEAPIPAA